MTEHAKTFHRLAKIGGFYPPLLKKTHRGIVARMALPKLEGYESDQFMASLPRLCSHPAIPVREGDKILHYINI